VNWTGGGEEGEVWRCDDVMNVNRTGPLISVCMYVSPYLTVLLLILLYS